MSWRILDIDGYLERLEKQQFDEYMKWFCEQMDKFPALFSGITPIIRSLKYGRLYIVSSPESESLRKADSESNGTS